MFPPTAPKITARVVVHAGHPGVNTANAPPSIVELPDFKFINFELLFL